MTKLCFSFFSMVLLLLFCVIIASSGMNISTDESSLLALKSSIINMHSHPIILANWSNASSVCDWIGVTCGTRILRVIALDISQMGLSGTIPSQFGNLSFLVSLNASGNNFSGNLPDSLSHLHRLKIFDFNVNNLTGEISSWFGFLSNLQVLNLGQNHFTGSIPLSLFNLSKLETLDLSFNQVNGSIPSTIFNLSTLENLRLVSNSLSGTLPQNLCLHLKNIRKFEVTDNHLSGEMPKGLSMCFKLRCLGLNYNQFEGTIPQAFGNLTSLEFFRVGGNNLRGRVPKEIGYLHNLKELHTENNHITGFLPPHMFNMSSLQLLDMNTNNISGRIPREMSNLHKLEEVYLQINSFSGSIPWDIFNISTLLQLNLGLNSLSGNLPPRMGSRLPNLVGISFYTNDLTGAIPSYISNCSKLEVIFFSYNSFSGPIPNSLGELRLLKILNMEDNKLTSESSTIGSNIISSIAANCRYLGHLILDLNPLNIVLPSSFGNLSTSLYAFSVNGCNIKGNIPDGIGNLSSLIELDLSKNDLFGVVPRAIKGLEMVQLFDSSENRLSGSLPSSICDLKYLWILNLGKNQFWGSIPECIGNVTSLRKIYLYSNRLSFNIPSNLWDLKDLLYLDLSSNFLNGSLPPKIGNLNAAIYINLSVNHISGYIPTTIGGLQQLVTISLENNLLQGPIPDSFANIISLEWLDLSNNNLTRRIPKSLETLRYLRFLNVSCNRLSGEIPSKGPFSNFSYQSFLCNEELCGSPRLKVPPCNADFSSPLSTRIILWIAFISMMAAFVVGVSLYILIKWKCKRPYNNEAYSVGEVVLTRISYYELQRATQGFDNRNLIGTGSFGSVYKGRFTYGLLLAVKVFNLQVEGAFKSFDTECKVLCNVRHRNLTKVITACSNADFKVLILRYMPNGSLDNWLYSNEQSLDIMQRLNIMIDVACALEYLHHDCAISIVHCDLKPSNVLIDDDMVGHVSDFGISKLLGHDESIVYTMTLAAIGYIAPEYGSSGMVSTKADIYSYGIMLMEVFTKRKPNDEMFEGDLTLKRWVSNSLSNNLDEILDPTLLKHEKLQFRQNMQCISSILELALDCTIESPNERMDIGGVLAKLNKTRHQFLTIF
ncbi:LRR receptor-like serine/threonine-protein kinase EFR isoform X1 [Ipomoea triloba]|uniref:LRR receptor-like serine/threonine-protein kinase EFR isoform X1 n=1 Tax=Ipomoea triloba TaxID=35885 RepID=UPI00125E8DAE|nr:LRR receptor-like serine/threonine-protein kinase EFR isoform X1 [Ipomoea triloba]XP_031100197.1 LRR receptor-like serine/threonine-protein kinase EFR isoform X1 [Ipomoea triloba]